MSWAICGIILVFSLVAIHLRSTINDQSRKMKIKLAKINMQNEQIKKVIQNLYFFTQNGDISKKVEDLVKINNQYKQVMKDLVTISSQYQKMKKQVQALIKISNQYEEMKKNMQDLRQEVGQIPKRFLEAQQWVDPQCYYYNRLILSGSTIAANGQSYAVGRMKIGGYYTFTVTFTKISAYVGFGIVDNEYKKLDYYGYKQIYHIQYTSNGNHYISGNKVGQNNGFRRDSQIIDQLQKTNHSQLQQLITYLIIIILIILSHNNKQKQINLLFQLISSYIYCYFLFQS